MLADDRRVRFKLEGRLFSTEHAAIAFAVYLPEFHVECEAVSSASAGGPIRSPWSIRRGTSWWFQGHSLAVVLV